jgi:ankyrin repeat protein
VRTDRVIGAVNRGDPAALRRGLASGGDPNAGTSSGRTALGTASVRGDRAAVQLLLKSGARPNTRNRYGRTPVALSAFGDRSGATIELLAAAGADVNARDSLDYSPLLTAVDAFNAAAVIALLRAGADANGHPERAAALRNAILTRQVAVVRALLGAGADFDRPLDPPRQMRTARDLAHRMSDPDLRRLAGTWPGRSRRVYADTGAQDPSRVTSGK